MVFLSPLCASYLYKSCLYQLTRGGGQCWGPVESSRLSVSAVWWLSSSCRSKGSASSSCAASARPGRTCNCCPSPPAPEKIISAESQFTSLNIQRNWRLDGIISVTGIPAMSVVVHLVVPHVPHCLRREKFLLKVPQWAEGQVGCLYCRVTGVWSEMSSLLGTQIMGNVKF